MSKHYTMRERKFSLRFEPSEKATVHGGEVECFFDDTQLEGYGRSFEGVQVNYEGKLAVGWQTLWVGPFLVDGMLGYAGDVSSQLRFCAPLLSHPAHPSSPAPFQAQIFIR